jgi:hypothetical protein
MPSIPIGLNVDPALPTEQGEVEEVPCLTDLERPLPLRRDLLPLELGPEAVFQGALVVEVVDLDCLGELGPGGRSEDDPAPAAAEDGLV